MATFTNNKLYPTIITSPDIRYAASFLNAKYRDYAVPGEVIADKITVEVMVVRPNDSRVISFQQNHRSIYDVAMDLRIELLNNPDFRYSHSNELGYYVSATHDMYLINKNKIPNVIVEKYEIDNGLDEKNKTLTFPISTSSNGFFIHLQSRDCDKALIEFLTNEYNHKYQNYFGNDSTSLAEKNRFNDQTWKESNCILSYDVVISGNTSAGTKSTFTYEGTKNIRLNETFAVLFQDTFLKQLSEITSIIVHIKGFNCYKLQMMYRQKSTLGDKFLKQFEALAYPDNGIELTWCTINNFVDSAYDIDLLGNEWLLALLDIPFVLRETNKVSKIAGNNAVLVSSLRPYSDIWTTNTVWAERIFDYGKNGKHVETSSSTTIRSIEEYIYGIKDSSTEEPTHTNISLNTGLDDDFLIKEVQNALDNQ